jgi:CheY-like chemotaxis protein
MGASDQGSANAGRRVLIVEDEAMIRMLLDDMLTELGYTVAAEAARIDEAIGLVHEAAFDLAILDVNLNGQSILPVVEALLARNLPFVFATGYGQRGVPEAFRDRPTLQKPFQSEALARLLASVAPRIP